MEKGEENKEGSLRKKIKKRVFVIGDTGIYPLFGFFSYVAFLLSYVDGKRNEYTWFYCCFLWYGFVDCYLFFIMALEEKKRKKDSTVLAQEMRQMASYWIMTVACSLQTKGVYQMILLSIEGMDGWFREELETLLENIRQDPTLINHMILFVRNLMTWSFASQ